MDVTPLIPEGRQLIQAFDKGGFTISREQHKGSVIVLPNQTVAWSVLDHKQMRFADFEPHESLLKDCEVLLIGLGPTFAMLDPEIRNGLKNWSIVAEPMSTDAACRTYNVLLSEDRKVGAALIAL